MSVRNFRSRINAIGRFARLVAVAILAVLPAAVPAGAESSGTLPLTIVTDSGVHTFHVEQARTERQRETGLMNRKTMPADHGMLFVFPRTMRVTMWMKDTLIPLDMIFVRENGTIAGIAPDAAPLSEMMIPSSEPVRFVLELNAGTVARIGARAGDRVSARPIMAPVGK